MNLPDDRIPKSEIDARINRLQAYMQTNSMDAALICQQTDFYYFSGTVQQGFLYIPARGSSMLMIRKSYDRAKNECPLENIVRLSHPKQLPELLRQNGYDVPKQFGIEMDVISASMYLNFQKMFNDSTLSDVSHFIRLVRSVKSEYEINMMRQAARLSDQVAGCVKELLKEGITEIELAGKLEAEARKLGHQGIVRMRLWGNELFYGHLMAGPSAAVPSFLSSPTGGMGPNTAISQGAGFRRIRRHEPILVDYAFAHKGYISDHTRIFSLGDLDDHWCKAHEAMLDVQALIKKEAKPGVRAGDIYELSFERARELGYADYFMGFGDDRIRFVGHGVGLELDEYPFLAKGMDMPLKSDMMLAIEPKLVFPDQGVVGIENIHRVTENGLEQFSQFEENIIRVEG